MHARAAHLSLGWWLLVIATHIDLVAGRSFEFHTLDRHPWVPPFYQEVVHGVIRDVFGFNPPPGLFVDVGAHVGEHALYAASEGYHVIAYEPHPVLAQQLREKASSLGLADYLLVREAAVGDLLGHGTAALHLVEERHIGGSYLDDGPNPLPHPEDREVVMVERTTLGEDIFEDIVMLKIDVQGYELHVLNGLGKLLRHYSVKHIVIEFGPDGLERAGSDPFEFLTLLHEMGCQILLPHFTLAHTSHFRWPILLPEQFMNFTVALRAVGAAGGHGETDLFCTREEWPSPKIDWDSKHESIQRARQKAWWPRDDGAIELDMAEGFRARIQHGPRG